MQQINRRVADDGADSLEFQTVYPNSTSYKDSLGASRSRGVMSGLESFSLLPAAAAAAGKSSLILTLGVGTEVVTRAAKGGVNLQTQVTTPADNDDAMLIPAVSSSMIAPITAISLIRFATRINLTSIASMLASFGLQELATDPNPTVTAGEGALFLADPGQVVTTGLTAAQHLNWILAHKVNGADTFTATAVPLAAGVDVDFTIQLDANLKANFYINGALVGQGPALTSGDSVSAFCGIRTKAAAQKDFDARFVELDRLIG